MKVTIKINPKYAHLREFIAQIPTIMDEGGTYIYGGRRNLIKRFEAPDGTMVNVKRFKQPQFLNNIIYSTGIRQPKGIRAFTYPERLLAKGITTPEAIAYIEYRNAIGLLQQSYFISLQCPYRHLLYELGDATPEVYEPIAKALGKYAAYMHEQEVLHLDFSPGNILWDQDAEGAYHFSIVDINRMRFGAVDIESGCKNFCRLWGPKRFIQLLVETYAEARHVDPAICVDITMKARADFWRRYQKKREIEFKLEL